MRDEDPGDSISGLVGLVAYIIFQVVLLVIEHIWWILGISAGVLILYLLIKYLKKVNLNGEMIWKWLLKYKRQVIYVVLSGIILVIFISNFWTVFLIMAVIWTVFLATDKLVKKFFGCRVCDVTGRLSGYNSHLDLEFDNDICYCCNGKHLVFKDKSDWYKIALKTGGEIKKLKRHLVLLDKQFQKYSSEVKIGGNVKSEGIISRDASKRNRFQKSKEELEAILDFHREIEKKAHIFLHELHIKMQDREWDKTLEDLERITFEARETALAIGDEAEFLEKCEKEFEEFEDLMESDLSDHIDPKLKLDISKASEKLRILLKESV